LQDDNAFWRKVLAGQGFPDRWSCLISPLSFLKLRTANIRICIFALHPLDMDGFAHLGPEPSLDGVWKDETASVVAKRLFR
jgi:hypothetical protein